MLIKNNPDIDELKYKDIIVTKDNIYEIRKDNKVYDLLNNRIVSVSIEGSRFKNIIYLFRY